MSFRLVQKSVTLNGIMTLICVISPNLVAYSGALCIKVVEDIPKPSATGM